MGIWFIYQTSLPSSILNSLGSKTGIPYFSISISLNILLTLLIVIRLLMHSRNIRNSVGAGAGGVYKAIVTMLIESSALYAVSSILFIGPWGANSWVADIFLPILAQNQVRAVFLLPRTTQYWDSQLSNRCVYQVIAPFLITLRVANQSALTSKTIVSGNTGSMHFISRGESTGGNIETVPDVGFHREKV